MDVDGLCHATRFKPFLTDFGPGRRGRGKGFQVASDVKRRSGAQGFLMFFDSEYHGFEGQVMNME